MGTWIIPEFQAKANQAPWLFVLEKYQKSFDCKGEYETRKEDSN